MLRTLKDRLACGLNPLKKKQKQNKLKKNLHTHTDTDTQNT